MSLNGGPNRIAIGRIASPIVEHPKVPAFDHPMADIVQIVCGPQAVQRVRLVVAVLQLEQAFEAGVGGHGLVDAVAEKSIDTNVNTAS